MATRLQLYSRPDCHLCEEMAAVLEEIKAELEVEVEQRRVDDNPVWAERWGEKIPVLVRGEREICHYWLDLAALRAVLEE